MYDYNQKPDLNITPLVDVMLVLLVLLMVTAPVMEYEEQISLPQGSVSKQLSDVKSVTILVEKEKIITIEHSKYLFATFKEDFATYSSNIPKDTPIHIRADQTLSYSDVMFVLKVVKQSGYSKVSLITDG
ncbi:MAG: biopolymer transporter ExbD [Arcobacteraceae bacterium]|nr:biopolymer transporter ExbD [Arcobacteraceae bacterium]